MKWKADINITDKNGWSVIDYAVMFGEYNTVELLIKYGANINKKDKLLGNTPFLKAIKNFASIDPNNDSIKLLELLSKNGSNINEVNNYGATALMIAVDHRKIKIIEFLLNNNISINTQDNKGNSALFYAVISGIYDIIELLIKHNADLNIKNNEGKDIIALVNEGRYSISEKEKIIKLINEKGYKVANNDIAKEIKKDDIEEKNKVSIEIKVDETKKSLEDSKEEISYAERLLIDKYDISHSEFEKFLKNYNIKANMAYSKIVKIKDLYMCNESFREWFERLIEEVEKKYGKTLINKGINAKEELKKIINEEKKLKKDIDNYNLNFEYEEKLAIQLKELDAMKKKLSSVKKQKKDVMGIIKYCGNRF